MDTISPIYARLVLRELERRAVDTAPLFAGTTLNREKLYRGGDISLADFLQILRVGDRLMSDEQLGFVLGKGTHAFAMGPVGAAMAAAPSVREGLRVLESYTRLHATYIDISARSSLSGLTVAIVYGRDTGSTERLHTETAMFLLQQYLETIIGQPASDICYRLAIPEPANRADYERALHGSIHFGAAENAVDVPRKWLDIPSPFYHPELWRQALAALSKGLRELSERRGSTYTQHVLTLLYTSDPPLPELATVASALRMSERTLNRRLQGESTSFRALKQRAQMDRARLHLRQTDHSVEAIAEELGYKDVANFRRAFRKNQGCSPAEYRRRIEIDDA